MNSLVLINAKYEQCEPSKPIIGGYFPTFSAFHYITEGYGYYNGVRLGPGQFFCGATNHLCGYIPDEKEPWSYYFFEIAGNFDDGLFRAYSIDPEKPYGDFLCMDEIPKLFQLYMQYKNRCTDNPEFYRMLAGTLLAMHNARPKPDTEPDTQHHIREITNYIDTYYHQHITVEEIASHFHFSRKYMRNLFVRKIGLSPKQYLQKVRMEKAAFLLRETIYEIGTIAVSTGHSDIFAFSKAFRNYFGISPSEYRRSHKE